VQPYVAAVMGLWGGCPGWPAINTHAGTWLDADADAEPCAVLCCAVLSLVLSLVLCCVLSRLVLLRRGTLLFVVSWTWLRMRTRSLTR